MFVGNHHSEVFYALMEDLSTQHVSMISKNTLLRLANKLSANVLSYLNNASCDVSPDIQSNLNGNLTRIIQQTSKYCKFMFGTVLVSASSKLIRVI